MRIGMGYDIHRLVPGRKLILGGVPIPFDKGLLGHSDADVAVHAICDALLGAAGMGDIGEHFPDTDPQYNGICSLNLLTATVRMLRDAGYSIVNIDTTIVAQAPRLSGYRNRMREEVAGAASVPVDVVNIKATTTEGLGVIGREEAISAMCVALIRAAFS